jgi:nitrogen fixation protein FixH
MQPLSKLERRNIMKRIVLVILVIFLTAGLSYAKDFELKKKVDDVSVGIRMDKNPPIVGANQVAIALQDKAGKPITDAKVLVNYSMPAMPGMPPMNYKTEAQLKGDAYNTTLEFSMPGSWNVDVKIARGGKTSTVKFNVDAK